MASEDNSYFTEDEFIFKKTQLSDLKSELTLQLKKLIQGKETFDSELLKLNRTITQSKDERIFLIQSLTNSNSTTFERRPTSDPIPFLPSDDEVSQQNFTDEMSPNSKQLIHHSPRDEDYIEKRGRKPKTLRVSIPISQIELPPEVVDNMNKSRSKFKKSIKRNSIHSNNTHAFPPMFSTNHSKSDNPTTQITRLPTNTDFKQNNLPYNPPNISGLVFFLNSPNSQHQIAAADYAMYMQKGVERDLKEDSGTVSENQSPNSKVGKPFVFSNRLEEENDKLKAPPL